jgi:hypothetical protein
VAGAPPQTPLGELAVMSWDRNKTGMKLFCELLHGAAYLTKNNNKISFAIIRNFLFLSYPNVSEYSDL